MKSLLSILILLLSFSCSNSKEQPDAQIKQSDVNNKNENKSQKITEKRYSQIQLIDTIPHDTKAYTQGLYFYEDYLYESTGQYGESSIRKIDPNTGEVLKKIDLEDHYFAEGLTIIDDKIYVLTWMETICFVYNVDTFEKIDSFRYPGQGWGLTHNEDGLIMSNGSNNLLVYSNDFKHKFTIPIYNNNSSQYNINEMEYIDGNIFTNIYGEDAISIIDYKTGDVINKIYANFLRDHESDNPLAEVMNGIAYDRENKLFYLTGKNWSKIYKIKIK